IATEQTVRNDDDAAFRDLCAKYDSDFIWTVMVLRGFEKGVKQFDSALHHCASGERASESKRIRKNSKGKFKVDGHASRFLSTQSKLLEHR
ncbi:MAG: hypothetical protein ACPGUC_08955, partial [Gammaproteobacteria bacterium]